MRDCLWSLGLIETELGAVREVVRTEHNQNRTLLRFLDIYFLTKPAPRL